MLKLFGLGLNKTGTTTLGACARILGRRHVSCRRDLLIEIRQGRYDRLFQVCDAFDAFEDWPCPLVYRQLLERYGDRGRYVLTVRRSAQAWLRSLSNHALVTSVNENCRLLAYGYRYPHGFEQEHLAFYERHNAEIVAHFARQGASHLLKVLCWEKGDGWAELCGLLGEPVPNAPFPFANRTNKSAIPAHPNFRPNVVRVVEQLTLLGRPMPEPLVL